VWRAVKSNYTGEVKNMLLENLNQTDKEKFVELAYKAAYADRSLSDEEMHELAEFRRQCNVSSIGNTGSFQELLDYFGDRPAQVRRIVFFGLYTVLYSNDIITELDQKMIDSAKADMHLSEEEIRGLAEVAQEMRKAHVKLRAIIAR
jgi:hypothetical protein